MDNTIFRCFHKPTLFLTFSFLHILFISISCVTHVKCSSDLQIETTLNQNCGKLDLVPTDIRSFAPWTAAIFRRVGESTTRWKLHTSGTIIAPGLVQSTQAGPVGRFPSDKDPRNFLIVAGVNTSDFFKHDQFAQYSRVNFIQPLNFNETHFESFYHEVVYYLATPLDFSTPFVKALCFPYFAANPKNQFLKSLRAALDAGVPIPTPASGFASGRTRYGNGTKTSKTRDWKLKVWKLAALSAKACTSIFRFYYGQSLTSFCHRTTLQNSIIYNGVEIVDKIKVSEYSKNDDELCFSQGIRSHGIIGAKWFGGSTAGLIPGRKFSRCGNNTVYISAVGSSDPNKYTSYAKFFAKLEKCGDANFSCASLNSNQCIPLYRTCDSTFDCEDKSDEHPDICVWKTGQKESKELKPIQLNVSIDFDPRILALRCPDFEFILNGVRCFDSETLVDVSCRAPFYYGRRIRIECDNFYTAAKYSFDHMDLFCNFDGQWEGLRPIYCRKECGVLDGSHKLRASFPWEITIFERGVETCGGTLIQPTFVLTDGRCVKSWIESPESRSTMQISFADDVSLPKDKAARFQIRNSWISSDSEASRSKYESGIALIQISKPMEPMAKDLNRVMAACFLFPPFSKIHPEQVAMIGSKKLVAVSRENCEAVKTERFCTTSTLNKAENNSLGAIKFGTGLFLRRLETSTGKSKHVLQGMFSGATKDGRGTFKNVDFHADWILDILEANS